MSGWTSPRLGVRFEVTLETLEIYRPDGERFLSFTELARLRDQERQRAETALTELEAERSRNEILAARLREMGIDPNQL
jgi:hypothetical protein